MAAAAASSRVVAILRTAGEGSVLCRGVAASVRLLLRSLSVRSSWIGRAGGPWRPAGRDFRLSRQVLADSRLARALDWLFVATSRAARNSSASRLVRDVSGRVLRGRDFVEAAGLLLLTAAIVHGALHIRQLAGAPAAAAAWLVLLTLSILVTVKADVVCSALVDRVARARRS